MSPLVVECAGLPGSGKTTLAAHTRRVLETRGVACRIEDLTISAAAPRWSRARRRLLLAAARCALRPVTSAQDVRAIRRLTGRWDRDALAGTVQWLAVARLVERAARQPRVSLLEEGPLQTAWTLAVRAGAPEPAQRAGALLRRAPRIDRVVVTTASPQVLGARLDARASRHSRTQLLPPEERARELEHGARLLGQLFDARPRLDCPPGAPEELGRWTAAWLLQGAGQSGGSWTDAPSSAARL